MYLCVHWLNSWLWMDWEECVAFAAVSLRLSHCDRDFTLTLAGHSQLLGIWKWPLRYRWGAWPSWSSPEEFFLCMLVFATSTWIVILQKTEQGLNIPNPKRDLLCSLCIYWSPPGVVEAIHWNSISYLCPFKSQYGVREPLPGLSWHTLPLSPSSPHMPWTSKDILKLDICLVFICS